MAVPYRAEGIADFSFDAGELSRAHGSDQPLTISLAGTSGTSGRSGHSGMSGFSGTTRSDGTQGPGGDGSDGGPGSDGSDGTSAQSAVLSIVGRGSEVYLETGDRSQHIKHPFRVDARGGHGGSGGDGGSGGSGGSGSPSGSRGSDGRGGDGGDGGDGGVVEIRATHPHLLGMVAEVDTSAGEAGHGGSGSPRGRSGRPGRAGSHVLVCGGVQGTRFGLRVESLSLTHDGTACGGNLARGSTLVLDGVGVANHGSFDVPAPFGVHVTAHAAIEALDAVVVNADRPVPPGRAVTLPAAVRLSVRQNVEVGRYDVTLALRSAAFGDAASLDEGRMVTRFRVPVNHRVSEQALAGLTDDQAREARVLVDEAHAMPPEKQAPHLLAALVSSFAPPEGLSDKQKEAFAPGLDGSLLDPKRLFASMDALRARDARACAAIGEDFVKSLATASKVKAFDLVLMLLASDGVLSAEEKTRLRAVATALEVPDAWVTENAPQVFVPGDTKVGSGASNRTAALLLPLLVTSFAFALTWLVAERRPLPPELLGATLGIGALLALGALYPLLFRVACPGCGSTNVEAAPEGGGALVGDEDTLRCVECGTRGTLRKRARAEVRHAGTDFARGSPWRRIGPLAALAVGAAGLRVWAHREATLVPCALGAGIVLAVMGIVSFFVLRVRRFPLVPFVLAAVVAVAFLVLRVGER